MNRESALLGTKTYSIFTGCYPYLDEYLRDEGKLTFLTGEDDIKEINVQRDTAKQAPVFEKDLASEITNKLLELSGNA